MNFSVSKTIQNLGTHIFSNSSNIYSSTPALDFVNPGVNIRLYTDVVPIHAGQLTHNIETKVQKDEESETKSEIRRNEDDENQRGAGIDKEQNAIDYSFLHPRPIKTEVMQTFQMKQSKKRKSEENTEKNETRKKPFCHYYSIYNKLDLGVVN